VELLLFVFLVVGGIAWYEAAAINFGAGSRDQVPDDHGH
jgi:hypothetical protein